MEDVFLNFHKSTKLIIKKRKKIFWNWNGFVVYFCHKVKRVPYQKKGDLFFFYEFLITLFQSEIKMLFFRG